MLGGGLPILVARDGLGDGAIDGEFQAVRAGKRSDLPPIGQRPGTNEGGLHPGRLRGGGGPGLGRIRAVMIHGRLTEPIRGTARGPVPGRSVDRGGERHGDRQRGVGTHGRAQAVGHHHGVVSRVRGLGVVDQITGARGPGEIRAVQLPLISKWPGAGRRHLKTSAAPGGQNLRARLDRDRGIGCQGQLGHPRGVHSGIKPTLGIDPLQGVETGGEIPRHGQPGGILPGNLALVIAIQVKGHRESTGEFPPKVHGGGTIHDGGHHALLEPRHVATLGGDDPVMGHIGLPEPRRRAAIGHGGGGSFQGGRQRAAVVKNRGGGKEFTAFRRSHPATILVQVQRRGDRGHDQSGARSAAELAAFGEVREQQGTGGPALPLVKRAIATGGDREVSRVGLIRQLLRRHRGEAECPGGGTLELISPEVYGPARTEPRLAGQVQQSGTDQPRVARLEQRRARRWHKITRQCGSLRGVNRLDEDRINPGNTFDEGVGEVDTRAIPALDLPIRHPGQRIPHVIPNHRVQNRTGTRLNQHPARLPAIHSGDGTPIPGDGGIAQDERPISLGKRRSLP